MFPSCRNAFNPVPDILEKAEFPSPYNGDVLASSIVLTLIIVHIIILYIVENNSGELILYLHEVLKE